MGYHLQSSNLSFPSVLEAKNYNVRFIQGCYEQRIKILDHEIMLQTLIELFFANTTDTSDLDSSSGY